jgi:putative oxidoreductase
MNAVLNIGKYLFAVPFAVFGIIHLMNADAMAGMAPFGGSIIIYITGLALIAATVSIIIWKDG